MLVNKQIFQDVRVTYAISVSEDLQIEKKTTSVMTNLYPNVNF